MYHTFTTLHTRYGNWFLHLYFKTDELNADEIVNTLYDIGCPESEIRKARKNLYRGDLDTGLTFSNFAERASVMVIAKTSNAAQFFNSLLHELNHLHQNMIVVFGLSPYGEPPAYLAGDTACELYPLIKPFLCDCSKRGVH